MLKRVKYFSLLLSLVLLLQSFLATAVNAQEEINDVTMEISIPQISLTSFSTTAESVELVWTSSNDSVDAASYDIYRDGNNIKNINSFTFTDSELTPETNYKYIVKAKDNDGNEIAVSNILDVTTTSVNADKTSQESSTTPSGITEQINLTESAIFKNCDPNFESDRYIIKYKNNEGKIRARKAFEKISTVKKGKIDDTQKYSKDFDVICLNQNEKIKDLTSQLVRNNLDSEIEYIQPDYQLSLSSNDPYYSSQWGLENREQVRDNNRNSILEIIESLTPILKDAIKTNEEFIKFLENTPTQELRAKLMSGEVPGDIEPYILMELSQEPAIMNLVSTSHSQSEDIYLCDSNVSNAWDKTTGKGVTVALIDTGVEVNHEDLAENIWRNLGEIPSNGLDDDGNGKIDDINGWNFIDNNNIVFDINNITDENHGTHIAGIIAAVRDNQKGISGVAPSANVMSLKVFKNGVAYTSDIISAIQYAESMGVKIVNCSWGSTDYNSALKDTMQNSNMLFVCSAGNSNSNIDSTPIYPAAFNCSNILSVASVNKYGNLSWFSNYGENNVDV